MRILFAVLMLGLHALSVEAQEPSGGRKSIDLRPIGYPRPPCDYLFPEDGYSKNRVEFLDSERMLVSFPLDTAGCEKDGRLGQKFRSVVIDRSGKVLHSFDWQRGENIQAGPDGHLLFSTEKEIRVLDSDFSVLQIIPERLGWSMDLIVDPARRGFAIRTRTALSWVIYFSGSPAKQSQQANLCNVIVVEGGFVCWDRAQPSLSTVHVNPGAPQPELRDIDTVLLPGLDGNPDRKWVAPGRPAELSRYGRSSSSGRLMYFGVVTLLPFTDSTGLGNFLRVIVVDTSSGRTILRKHYDRDADVALSPDGKWFAVREGTKVTFRAL